MKKKWSPPAIVLILIGVASYVLHANLQLPMVELFLFGSFLCFLVGIVLSLIAIFKGELIIFTFFILALGLLAFTKPSEKAFNKWLNNKHNYDCGPTECSIQVQKRLLLSKNHQRTTFSSQKVR